MERARVRTGPVGPAGRPRLGMTSPICRRRSRPVPGPVGGEASGPRVPHRIDRPGPGRDGLHFRRANCAVGGFCGFDGANHSVARSTTIASPGRRDECNRRAVRVLCRTRSRPSLVRGGDVVEESRRPCVGELDSLRPGLARDPAVRRFAATLFVLTAALGAWNRSVRVALHGWDLDRADVAAHPGTPTSAPTLGDSPTVPDKHRSDSVLATRSGEHRTPLQAQRWRRLGVGRPCWCRGGQVAAAGRQTVDGLPRRRR